MAAILSAGCGAGIKPTGTTPAGHTTEAASPGRLTFSGGFLHGLSPWTATGGGAQCANYGIPSAPPRLRGDFYTGDTAGLPYGRFDLPASQPGLPLQACELLQGGRPLALGSDSYYGDMFYVPKGWGAGTSAFWGVEIAQLHFQNIWAAPIAFQLHTDHLTLALETGACNGYTSAKPGCRWRSNAENPNGNPGNLGAQYVVPGPMQLGVWHEVIMHVHWAEDSSGRIQAWHRVAGDPKWTETVNLHGFPTIQWDVRQGCCQRVAIDKIGAYRGPAVAPVSVWEANFMIGTSFRVVAATMPARASAPPS